MNAALGVAGEAGEIADLIKKHVFHGHALDREKLLTEIGDELWYLSCLASALDATLEQVAIRNISKLRLRYPDGFSHDAPINAKRD